MGNLKDYLETPYTENDALEEIYSEMDAEKGKHCKNTRKLEKEIKKLKEDINRLKADIGCKNKEIKDLKEEVGNLQTALKPSKKR